MVKKIAFWVWFTTVCFLVFNKFTCETFGLSFPYCHIFINGLKGGIVGFVFFFVDPKFFVFYRRKE